VSSRISTVLLCGLFACKGGVGEPATPVATSTTIARTGNNIVSTMFEATDPGWIHDVSTASEEAARYLYNFGDLPDGVPR